MDVAEEMKLTDRQRYWLEQIQGLRGLWDECIGLRSRAWFSYWGDVRWQEDVGEERRVAADAGRSVSTGSDNGC